MSGKTNLALQKLIAADRVFSQINQKMQVSTRLVFMEIARAEERGEEISVQDIERRVGLQSGPASRNVYYWTDDSRGMASGGHGMITVEQSKQDRRRVTLKLTPKGRALVNQLKEIFEDGEAER